MSKKISFFILTVLLLALTSCSQGPLQYEVNPIESTDISATMQYLQNIETGPEYVISMTVPEEWVGQFATRNEGNILHFDYLAGDKPEASVFSIEALSSFQYWEQQGSYPGYYTNIINENDTFFVYHLPIDSYYSGLSPDTFDRLAQSVPEIIATFDVEAVN